MTLRVVCLNVWNGGLLWEPMVAFCQQQAADIYLLQEVFHNPGPAFAHLPQRYRTYEGLQHALNLPFGQFAPTFIEKWPGAEVVQQEAQRASAGESESQTQDMNQSLGVVQGNAILSRFPLQPVSVTHYDVPFNCRISQKWAFPFVPRNLQHVTAQVGTTQLHLFNTQGIWGTDGLDSPRRIAMTQQIMAEVGDSWPVILGGDFNVSPHTQTIDFLEKTLTNVFKDELTTSFNVSRKNLVTDPGYATAVVDMLFISPEVKVLAHTCPQVDVTDHLPLVMSVEI